ncbi:MAG TPA: GntR family transcriptional regulator [Sphingobium sp.]|nr:GntR family transcriptional regulator [Sphingobium sp.]
MENRDSSGSQTLKAIDGLREWIVRGGLLPGQRVSEPMIIAELGVSRTPARIALNRMADDGLLARTGTNRFVVKEYTAQDIFDAIEIRGNLEGLAARLAAEGRASSAIVGQMEGCVERLDEIIASLPEAIDLDGYIDQNDRLHTLLIEAAGSSMVTQSIEKIRSLSFAAFNALVKSVEVNEAEMMPGLVVAQAQHRALVKCIRQGQGCRAQALAIEHAFNTADYLRSLFDADKAKTGSAKAGLHGDKGERLLASVLF